MQYVQQVSAHMSTVNLHGECETFLNKRKDLFHHQCETINCDIPGHGGYGRIRAKCGLRWRGKCLRGEKMRE